MAKQIFPLFISMFMALASSGCVSAYIYSSGRDYEQFQKPSIEAEDVQASFGKPVWVNRYVPPMILENTPEFIAWKGKAGRSPCYAYSECKELVAFCEVYQFNGPLADPQNGVPYAMAVGCTFLVAEAFDIFVIPFAVKRQCELSKEKFNITFWYGSNRHFIACFPGDIRDLPASPLTPPSNIPNEECEHPGLVDAE